MSDLQTNVGIKVVNQASEPLNKITSDMNEMSKTLQKANADSGLGQTLGNVGKGAQEASKGLSGMKGVMGGVVSELSPFSLGTAGLAAAVVFLGKVSLDAAQQVETVGVRARAVFGADFAAAQASAERLSQALRRDKEDILNMETSFAAMARGAGIASKESMILAEGLTEMSVKFAKINHLADEDAFEKMKQGLAGMGRGLKEYGIYLDDATLAEFAHQQGIKAKFEELNEGGQQLVRYMYIQDQLLEQEKNVGETTMSLSEAWKEFKAAIDPVLEVLGMLILIPLTQFFESMAGGINTAINLLRLLAASAKDTAADIYNMGVAVSNFFGITENAQKMSADNVEKEFARMQEASNQSLQSMSMDVKQITKDNKDFVDVINKGGFKAFGAGASAAADDSKKLKKAMDDLGKGFNDTFGDIARKSKDLEMRHNEAVEGIVTKQRDLYERLNDLRTAANNTANAFADIGIKFKEAMADLNTDREDKVVAQFQKVKDMYDQLQRSIPSNEGFFNGAMQNVIANMSDPASGKLTYQDVKSNNLTQDQEDMVNLTLQLHKEQQALKDYLAENLNLSDKLKASMQVGGTDFIKVAGDLVKQSAGAGVGRAQKSEFTLAMEELRKQAGATQKQYDKDTESNEQDKAENLKQQQKVKDEITALDKKRKAVEYAYQQERAEIGYTKVALEAFHGQYLTQMQDMSKVTEQTVQNVKTQLEQLRAALQQAQQDAAYAAQATSAASARGQSRAKFAEGGIVGSRAGGLDVTVGEGMYNEAIVPLPDGRSIPVRIEGGVGGGHTISVNLGGVVIKNGMDAQELVRMITTAIDNQLLKAR